MSKRGADTDPGGGSEPAPKKRIVFEPLQLGPISNVEELDIKTLQFQNQKLSLRLSQRAKIEDELRYTIARTLYLIYFILGLVLMLFSYFPDKG